MTDYNNLQVRIKCFIQLNKTNTTQSAVYNCAKFLSHPSFLLCLLLGTWCSNLLKHVQPSWKRSI